MIQSCVINYERTLQFIQTKNYHHVPKKIRDVNLLVRKILKNYYPKKRNWYQ